jgi:hypothetical protein
MRSLALIAVTGLLAACEAAPPAPEQDGPNDSFLAGGKADSAGISEGSPEALGVLALVNSADYTTLYKKARISSRAAHNILNYREGDDGVAGTADDQLFDTLAELDAVPYVGPATFNALLAYARAQGLVGSASGGTSAYGGSTTGGSTTGGSTTGGSTTGGSTTGGSTTGGSTTSSGGSGTWISGSVAYHSFLTCAVTACHSGFAGDNNDEISFIVGVGTNQGLMLGFTYHGQYFEPKAISAGGQYSRTEYFSGASPYAPDRTGSGSFQIEGNVNVAGRLLYINDMEYRFNYNPSDYSGEDDSMEAGGVNAPF